MKKFNVGDKVRITKAFPWQGIREGDTGAVTKRVTEHSWPVVTVKFDRTGNSEGVADEYLELVEEKMKTTYRIVGPNGQTDTFTENQVRALTVAGILTHTATHVHDDELVKIYKRPDLTKYGAYEVKDFRSNRVSLEEQFPKDN